jgi:hypothetical protein
MKKSRTIVLAAAMCAAASACSSADNKNAAITTVNKTVTNSSLPANTSSPANSSSSANTTSSIGDSDAYSFASPSDSYKTAYNARKKRDIPILKRVISSDMLEFMTEIGKANEEKPQTLDDVLNELCDRPQAPNGEIRNEKINGDVATVEYMDETGKWRLMDFVKEGSDWKLTMPKQDRVPADRIKQ